MYVACSVPNTFALKSRCRSKTRENRQFLAPCLWAGNPQILDDHFQIWLTSKNVTKFGWVTFHSVTSEALGVQEKNIKALHGWGSVDDKRARVTALAAQTQNA